MHWGLEPMLNRAQPRVAGEAANADAFDEAAASLGDYAVSLLTSSQASAGRRAASANALDALATIVLAIAEARERPPHDPGIIDDFERALASWTRAVTANLVDLDPLAPLGPALVRTRDLALERAARGPIGPPPRADAPAPLAASSGTPMLHRDVRLEAAPRPITARAFGALLPQRSVPPAEATPTQQALRRWARDALEELAIAGRLRRANEDEAWTSGRSFEERALTAVDALAAFGRGGSDDVRVDVARVIDDTLHDWSIPDPGRAFAATFALGCIHGFGAAARLQVYSRDLSSSTSGAIEDALALGASPHIDDVVLSLLCEDQNPDLLERALRVARRRGRVPAELAIDLLSHPELRVAIAAAQACAVLEPPIARAPLEDALFGPDALAVHAAESLARLQVPLSGWTARSIALTSGDLNAPTAAHAARLRVLHAQARDVEPLLELCAQLPRHVSLDLLGWLGSAHALGSLCAALSDIDPSIRERAAWSLARITGAGRDALGNIEVDADGNPLPDPDEEPISDTSDRTRRHPPTDPSFWTTPCAHAASMGAPRLRFGCPLDPGAVLDELIDPTTHQGVRRILVTELPILLSGRTSRLAHGGRLPPLDVDDWIARQQRLLALTRDTFDLDRPSGLPSPLGARP